MTLAENLAFLRRAYARLNEAYGSGEFLPAIEELCDPEIVIVPAGIMPDSAEMHGHDGMLRFIANQAEAFEDLCLEPEEMIEAAGGRVVVPARLAGRVRHTGLEVQIRFVHLCTVRGGRLARIDVYRSKEEALAAGGR